MAKHNELGVIGEELARKHLIRKGYKILDTNYKIERTDLDIIAETEAEIIIVEVKTRSSDFFGNPEEAVNFAKQKKLVDAADHYIVLNDIDKDVRFDVISILKNGNSFEINHIEEAFYPHEVS